jgi:hypothetical protein
MSVLTKRSDLINDSIAIVAYIYCHSSVHIYHIKNSFFLMDYSNRYIYIRH